MASALFSEEEKNRIRHHLGYLVTEPVSSIQLGFPRASQSMFLVEASMNRVPEAAAGQIRQYVAILDGIEAQLIEGQLYLVASKLGEIDIRPDHLDRLAGEYKRWAQVLADDLGVPLNAYSERFRMSGGGPMPLNMRVSNS